MVSGDPSRHACSLVSTASRDAQFLKLPLSFSDGAASLALQWLRFVGFRLTFEVNVGFCGLGATSLNIPKGSKISLLMDLGRTISEDRFRSSLRQSGTLVLVSPTVGISCEESTGTFSAEVLCQEAGEELSCGVLLLFRCGWEFPVRGAALAMLLL
mmetsp:Transcript_35387/g.76883  ORF Transcript_35387/g.76883 Transcript_35387/m.76883 type:complete len:156 (-) Transcript_35387:1632-2099(-)